MTTGAQQGLCTQPRGPMQGKGGRTRGNRWPGCRRLNSHKQREREDTRCPVGVMGKEGWPAAREAEEKQKEDRRGHWVSSRSAVGPAAGLSGQGRVPANRKQKLKLKNKPTSPGITKQSPCHKGAGPRSTLP